MEKQKKLKNIMMMVGVGAMTLFTSSVAHAATLSVVANRSSVLIGQPVRVDVSLDTQGGDVNAIQGELDFPANQFVLQNIVDGSSPFSFWIQPPAESASDSVIFSGIVPDGFEGVASSVVSVWLMPIASGTATITLNNIQLLQNDGKGTPIMVTTQAAAVIIENAIASSTSPRPVSFITPDPFTPVVSRDPNIYNDAYFLSFSTTDEGSGIAYYQVLEVSANGGSLTSDWQTAVSPYLLPDQTLSSNIYVRAVDHDGNFIVVEVPAEHSASEQAASARNSILILILCFLLLDMLFVAWVMLK